MTLPPMPNLPPPEERPRWVDDLLAIIAIQGEELHRLREENQALRDEVARLKGQKGKPSMGPSRLTRQDRKDNPGKRLGRGSSQRRIDRTQVIAAKDVPPGSRFKGYADYVVQELAIKVETTQYRVAKWLTPEGKIIAGELPPHNFSVKPATSGMSWPGAAKVAAVCADLSHFVFATSAWLISLKYLLAR
jgi:hypothetical protein